MTQTAQNQEIKAIWNETLNRIQEQLNTPTFETWFKNTKPVEMENGRLTVSTPSSFAKEWLESRHQQLLEVALLETVGHKISLQLVVAQANRPSAAKASAVKNEKQLQAVVSVSAAEHSLNEKYTFDSFVIGASNRFAHAAALAVAEKPAKAYNPLFIYGGVGLGKTHLLQAIANYVVLNHSRSKVKYVSTEKFTNDFINSIRAKEKISGFQGSYRNNDILLVDDIQFLEKKEATQEEFFHTFNTLYEAGKQVVISSDRPPRDISTLEDRLRSRFEWGLITDIQPPDLETRIAILKKRATTDGLHVPGDVLEYIASRIQSNIRELEGALIRVVAFSSLTKTTVDIESTKQVLKDIFPENSRPISIQKIQAEVCRYFGISRVDLVSSRRSRAVVFPRQVAMYLTRELTDLSLPKIGECFGGRDHTTVIHANSKIEKLIKTKKDIYTSVQELTNKIKQS